MPDSQHDPGTFPQNPARPAGNTALPPGNPPTQRPRPAAAAVRQPPGARQLHRPDPAHAPRLRPAAESGAPGQKRPMLPYAQESDEAHLERTERLRAMRQDFLSHSEQKIKPQKPRNLWLAGILTVCLLAACVAGGVILFQSRATLFTSPGQDVATQFLDAMIKGDYTAAFGYCSSSVQEIDQGQSIPITKTQFIDKATQADQDDGSGPISAYSMTDSSNATANNEQYTFTLTRHDKPIPNVIITVTNGADGWKVSGIDSQLFSPPAQPVPTPGPADQTATP